MADKQFSTCSVVGTGQDRPTMVGVVRRKMFRAGFAMMFVLVTVWSCVEYGDYRSYAAELRQSHLVDVKASVQAQVERVLADLAWHSAVRPVEPGSQAEADTLANVLHRISHIRFGRDGRGYLFAVSYRGDLLLDPAAGGLEGQNVWDWTDRTGKQVFQEILHIARTREEGGFVRYWWFPSGEGEEDSAKISFVRGVPGWNIAIGAGVNVNVLDKVVNTERRQALGRMGRHLVILAGCSGVMAMVVFAVTGFLTTGLAGDLAVFNRFFEKAVDIHGSIDLDDVGYAEFVPLAAAANAMGKARQEVLQALELSEQRYRKFIENTDDLATQVDGEGVLTFVNDAWAKAFGGDGQACVGQSVFEYVHPDDRDETILASKVWLHERKDRAVHENRLVRADGRILFVLWSISIEYDSTNRPVSVTSIGRDITDRKEAERELVKHQTRLQEMASELAMVEERERRHLAEALHDGIGQSLYAIKTLLASIRVSNDPACPERFDRVDELIDRTIEDARSLTFELCPPQLYEEGLPAAIEWLAGDFHERTGIHCDLQLDADEHIHMDVRSVAYRAVRELLHNIQKHSQAQNAQVKVASIEGAITISISDDGVGFDPAELQGDMAGTRGFGLFNIRERLIPLRGNVEIVAAPDAGCRVTLTVPTANPACGGNSFNECTCSSCRRSSGSS